MDEKFALHFWSEFSIGYGEFHYQVRKRKKGTESFTIPCTEEKKRNRVLMDEKFRSSSGQSSPSGMGSSTIRYEREDKNIVFHG
jgi:hypothetical protein